MSVPEYINSSYSRKNWLIKLLTNHGIGPITENHLVLAKQILTRKFLVGIYESAEESMNIFKAYFQWDHTFGSSECQQFLNGTYHMVRDHDITLESEDRQLILEKNRFDVELYEYAMKLFVEQGQQLKPYIAVMNGDPLPQYSREEKETEA